MKEITKEKYRKGLIGFGNESFKSPLYGEIGLGVKETVSESLKNGDVLEASNKYQKYVNEKIIPFVDTSFKEAIDDLSLDEPIDIIDNTEIENTLFMKPIETKIIDFEEKKEETKENKIDEVDDKSFILDFDKFNNVSSLEETSNVVPIVPNEDTKEVKEEVPTKSKTKVKLFKKNKSDLKKTGYIDTVILCLVAQLTIFGLLIVVLLMIK